MNSRWTSVLIGALAQPSFAGLLVWSPMDKPLPTSVREHDSSGAAERPHSWLNALSVCRIFRFPYRNLQQCYVFCTPTRSTLGIGGYTRSLRYSCTALAASTSAAGIAYHSIRPTRVEYVRPPTSLKLPRVPVKRPKVLRVATLY